MTLIIKNRVDDFLDIGTIHDNGLADIVANVDSNPKTSEIIDMVQDYFTSHYFTGKDYPDYPQELIGTIASKAINESNNFLQYLYALDIHPKAKEFVKEIYELGDWCLRTADDKEAIFVAYYDYMFGTIQILTTKIIESGLTADQRIVPMVAAETFRNSLAYWNDVYTNDGGSDAWYTYITDTIGGLTVEDIRWDKVMANDISGAVIGAVECFKNNETYDSITIGAGAGCIAASSKDLLLQVFKFLQDSEGLVRGGEEISAAASNASDITESVVNITTCASGHGVTLPKAKAGNKIFVQNNGANTATIATTGSDTIDGSSTTTIAAAGSKWFVCAANGAWLSFS